MTYYINPIWFYLMNISSEIKLVLCTLSSISLALSVLIFLPIVADGFCGDDDEKKNLKLLKKIAIASMIALFIGILIPSKETCIEMMAASQITHENVTATKEEIYEIVDYITDKVKGEEEE